MLQKEFIVTIPICVDLDKIIEFHQATTLTRKYAINANQSVSEHKTDINVHLVLIGEEEDIHPAYDMYEHIENIGLDSKHADHLLYLAHSFIEFEWKHYQQQVLNTDPNKAIYLTDPNKEKSYDMVELARNEISQMLFLLKLRDTNISATQISFGDTTEKVYTNSKNEKYLKPYKLNTSSVSDREVVEAMLTTGIEILFKKLKQNPNPILAERLIKIIEPTFDAFQKLNIDLTTNLPFKHANALSLFRKLVSQRTLDYLNKETILTSEPNAVSADQAQIIYSLLSLFNLISSELIEGHPDRTSRTKYIRALLFNSGNHPNNKDNLKSSSEFFNIKTLIS